MLNCKQHLSWQRGADVTQTQLSKLQPRLNHIQISFIWILHQWDYHWYHHKFYDNRYDMHNFHMSLWQSIVLCSAHNKIARRSNNDAYEPRYKYYHEFNTAISSIDSAVKLMTSTVVPSLIIIVTIIIIVAVIDSYVLPLCRNIHFVDFCTTNLYCDWPLYSVFHFVIAILLWQYQNSWSRLWPSYKHNKAWQLSKYNICDHLHWILLLF